MYDYLQRLTYELSEIGGSLDETSYTIMGLSVLVIGFLLLRGFALGR